MIKLINYIHKKIKKLDDYQSGDLLLAGFMMAIFIGVAFHFFVLVIKV